MAASRFFNFPSFPDAHPVDGDLQGCSDGHTGTQGQESTSHDRRVEVHAEHRIPGYANPAVGEVFDRFLIPRMFAQVAQGKLSAAESVSVTATEMRGHLVASGGRRAKI